ncbi:MAG: tetratricopeptide (TPR) repeat protein [Myxococcota bacterium]|jgi:tetratricopeptide (TPR) repeat protein
MMWALFLALASAQEPTGSLFLSLSPGAEVDVQPRRSANVIEIAIRGNHVPIRPQLEGRTASGMFDVNGLSVGGGTWFVSVYPQDLSMGLEAVATPEGYRFVWTPSQLVVPAEVETVSTVQELLALETLPVPGLPPTRTLLPLVGGAGFANDISGFRLPLVPWIGEPLTTDEQGLLTGTTLGHDAIVRFTHTLVSGGGHALEQTSRYRLAVAYDALALSRESDFYLEEMQAAGDVSQAVALLRARAAARLSDWTSMRTHCEAAATADLEHPATLQCFGVLAIRTGSPSPGVTGRLVAQRVPGVGGQMLAARALMRDHHYDEALALLHTQVETAERPSNELLALWGDAELIAGDLEQARAAWETVRWNSQPGKMGRLRLHHIDMLEGDPRQWLAKLPVLHVASDHSDAVGREALHLLSQIGHRFGDPEMEALALASLMSRYPETAELGSTLSSLMAACGGRLKTLFEAERYVEHIALYERCWHPALNEVRRDTETVQSVSVSYSALGLQQQALAAQQEVARMRSRDDRPDGPSTTRLAHLYNENGRPLEALQTVQYVRSQPAESTLQRSLMIEAALAHQALDQIDEALSEVSRASADDWDARALWAEMISARDGCEAARTEFGYQAQAGRPPLSMATRCLLELGDVGRAETYLLDSAHPAHDAQRAAVAIAGAQALPEREDAPEWYLALAREEEAFEQLRARVNSVGQ